MPGDIWGRGEIGRILTAARLLIIAPDPAAVPVLMIIRLCFRLLHKTDLPCHRIIILDPEPRHQLLIAIVEVAPVVQDPPVRARLLTIVLPESADLRQLRSLRIQNIAERTLSPVPGRVLRRRAHSDHPVRQGGDLLCSDPFRYSSEPALRLRFLLLILQSVLLFLRSVLLLRVSFPCILPVSADLRPLAIRDHNSVHRRARIFFPVFLYDNADSGIVRSAVHIAFLILADFVRHLNEHVRCLKVLWRRRVLRFRRVLWLRRILRFSRILRHRRILLPRRLRSLRRFLRFGRLLRLSLPAGLFGRGCLRICLSRCRHLRVCLPGRGRFHASLCRRDRLRRGSILSDDQQPHAHCKKDEQADPASVF